MADRKYRYMILVIVLLIVFVVTMMAQTVAVAAHFQPILTRVPLIAATSTPKTDLQATITAADVNLLSDPKDVKAYIDRGRALHLQGKLDEAIADYDEALRLDPN